MTRAASPFLKLAKYALTGAAALAWLAGVALALDAIPASGSAFHGWSWQAIGEAAIWLCLAGPIGAVLFVNARRLEAEGGPRLAWALVGVICALTAFFGLGLGWIAADAALEAPQRLSINNQLISAAAFPLLAVLGAAGILGAWASVATKPLSWAVLRKRLVLALTVAAGCGALLVLAPMLRGGPSAPIVGAPLLATILALTGALAIRSRKDSGSGELAGALLGYAAGAFGGLLAAGVLDAWQTPGDPRARFINVVFLWPVLIAGLMIATAAVVALAGGFRAALGRARRALA